MGALTHNGEVLQSLPANASQINFDKTGTDLNSTQVENAIKEVNTKANTNADDIDELKSGLIKHHSYTGEIAITTQSGALYRSGPVAIELPDTPTNVSVSLKINAGHTIGVMVHSISGKNVNVLVWATESTTTTPTIEFLYT